MLIDPEPESERERNVRELAAYRDGLGECRSCGAPISVSTGHLWGDAGICNPMYGRNCHKEEAW